MGFHEDAERASLSDVRARHLMEGAAADADLSGDAADLQRLCRAAVDHLRLDGAVIHLMTTSGPSGIGASSDPRSARFGDIPFTTGDGPCLDAFSRRRPVLIPDLEQVRDRWPGFSSAALADGVGAVFSLPLQVGAVAFGVLDLYAWNATQLVEDQVALALAFARVATEILLDAADGTAGPDGWGEGKEHGRLLDHRPEIHQAQGMVMVALGLTLADAMIRMRAHAFSSGLPLIDVARDIITGRPLPDTRGP